MFKARLRTIAMKKLITLVSLVLVFSVTSAQQLTQTIRGVIKDNESNTSLIGATVIVLGSDPIIGATTDINGNFRIENVPTGRLNLELSYIGYEPKVIPNVVVNSGKEVLLNLTMQESIMKMDEVVIVANVNKGEASNEMAMLSARSISSEETSRYAGGFNDPSRIMSNFAGVTATQDGSNDIIVRGNSPKYVQWRLEGIQITNPNHFGDQSAVGGAVSTLNNNVLANSDFYTGAFTAEYGDALSAVYDVKLRAGNNEKYEAVFGFGLLGTDITLEGPFKKGYGGSFIANYRYSTASVIADLGLADISGIPKFQDASYKLVFPTKKLGTFSVFGLGGYSSFLFEDVKPDTWETPGNRFMIADINEDYKKRSYLLNQGINHTFNINKNSYINSTLLYSHEGIDDDIYEDRFIQIFDEEGNHLRDSTVDYTRNLIGRLKKSSYRASVTYNNKINSQHKIQVGSKYALLGYEFFQSQFTETPSDRTTLVDFNENVSTVRNFVSWKYRINERLTMVSGVHNMNILLNNKSTIEPRVAFSFKLNNGGSLNAGYGKHSNMESIHNYFAKVEQEDGSLAEPNKDLGLLKAHHYVLGYEKRFGKNIRAKIEGYYQDLYNLPVANDPNSYYATINEGLEFQYIDLVNEGTGKNYGIEITLERFFNRNFYYMVNTSLYQSKYTALDGIERNTRYNGNYLANLLFGKEFTKLGKKQNQTLALNSKIFFAGGQKIIPLLRDEQGNLAVDPENNNYWDYSKAYENSIEDVYQIILSASYKWNKPKATHELFLNLDNITNNKGRINEFYDASEPGSVGYLTQFGFFPNLMYRVYF